MVDFLRWCQELGDHLYLSLRVGAARVTWICITNNCPVYCICCLWELGRNICGRARHQQGPSLLSVTKPLSWDPSCGQVAHTGRPLLRSPHNHMLSLQFKVRPGIMVPIQENCLRPSIFFPSARTFQLGPPFRTGTFKGVWVSIPGLSWTSLSWNLKSEFLVQTNEKAARTTCLVPVWALQAHRMRRCASLLIFQSQDPRKVYWKRITKPFFLWSLCLKTRPMLRY